MTIAPPNPPAIGGTPAHHSGTGNKPVTRVVIHSAVMECKPGQARVLGDMNRRGSTGGSWHYAVDPRETYQCSWDSFVCWHAPPNPHSIGIEMADNPAHGIARWQWRDQRRMLRRTARLTARLCLAYDLPLVFLDVDDVKAGHKGITTHNNVSKAFGQSDHWDPGEWPQETFMRLVHKYAAKIIDKEKP